MPGKSGDNSDINVDPLHLFDPKTWDARPLEDRRRVLKYIISKYYHPDKCGYDIVSMEDDLSENIVPILIKILSDLNYKVEKCDPANLSLRCANALLQTKPGQIYAAANASAVATLLNYLHIECGLSESDMMDIFLCMWRLSMSSKDITNTLRNMSATEDIVLVLKRMYTSYPLHEVGCRLLHHLGVIDGFKNSCNFDRHSAVIVDLISTPHALCKHSALYLLSMSFNSGQTNLFHVSLEEWERKVLPHFARLLIFASRSCQDLAMYTSTCFILADSPVSKFIVKLFASALLSILLQKSAYYTLGQSSPHLLLSMPIRMSGNDPGEMLDSEVSRLGHTICVTSCAETAQKSSLVTSLFSLSECCSLDSPLCLPTLRDADSECNC